MPSRFLTKLNEGVFSNPSLRYSPQSVTSDSVSVCPLDDDAVVPVLHVVTELKCDAVGVDLALVVEVIPESDSDEPKLLEVPDELC